ncbi:MAG: cache domain-containing protein [Bacteroidales bacterium]|jgi:PAS domain S-box-containing protein|nr:cache domain-containing protein [Bacteroidales bacterium]
MMSFLSKSFNSFIKLLGSKRNIVNLLLIQTIIVIAIIILGVGYFWIYNEYATYQRVSDRIHRSHIKNHKQLVKNETLKAVDYIYFRIQETEAKQKERLKSRVKMAYSIAQNIYNQHQHTKPKSQIKQMIKEVLRPIRFDQGKGYIFIGNLEGYDVLYPVAPQYEGKYLYDLQDDMGNYVMRDELNVVNNQGEGFVTGYWKRPGGDDNMTHKKISFVKLFEPLGWYIGTGEYVEDFEKEVQEEVLERLSKIRFEEEGYIFVNTYDGDALITDGKVVTQKKNLWDYKDPNGVKVIQEERKAVKNPEGGFLYYSWKKLNSDEIVPKMSFVKGVPEWQWMVGAGVYFEDITPVLNQEKSELKHTIQKNILTIIIVFGAVLTFLFVFTYFLSKKAKANVNSFLNFFKKASQNLEEIDVSKLDFNEFKTIAHSANQMIQEIKTSQNKTREDEALFERLFESAPEAIVLIGNDGKVIRANSAFTSLFGYAKDEVIHQDVDELIVPKELKVQAKEYHKRIIQGLDVEVEEIRIRKDQSRVFVSILSTPITFKQDQLGVYVIYRDITQQKETERIMHEAKTKAEESDRLKSAFLTNISHEVRTPMNAITGFSNLILNRDLTEENKFEYLNIINQSSNALLEIIDNIIDVSKLEAENLIINKIKCNIHPILDELYIDANQKKKELGLEKVEVLLTKSIKSNGFEIVTDPKRFKQIFANLLDNALKFTDQGVVEFGYHLEENNLLCFVKDTGIGFSKDQAAYIFEPFRQADYSSTRKYGGTGIGLTLAQKLAELLGGHIKVEAERNKGAHFFFSIPVEVLPQELETNVFYSNKINWSDKKIIIAEDVHTNYQFLYSVLNKTRADIFWAKDGEELIAMVEKNKNYDLILMDIQMPKMNGHNAFKHLRKKGINIPVIAQTAYAMEGDIQEIKNMGYNDYIIKPIEISSLYEKIATILD